MYSKRIYANKLKYLEYYNGDRQKSIYQLVRDDAENMLIFYNNKEMFQFFQNNKTVKYNNKFYNVTSEQYNKLLLICLENTL